MARTVAIGLQNFEEIIQKNYFYIDKTSFIREWWESGDAVTLIARPRRFGKTLNMSMLEHFFSVDYAGRVDLFEGLSIWKEESYRQLQGTIPVIFLSFATVKGSLFSDTRKTICRIITSLYKRYNFLLDSGRLHEREKEFFKQVSEEMEDYVAADSLRALCGYLARYYEKKPIILLDEYDKPMQEAYMGGFTKELSGFLRSLFISSFKVNPCLGRAIMMGTTEVGAASCDISEPYLLDMLNLKDVTTTSNEYATSFGFTEEEVLDALDECGLSGERDLVKQWYGGFIFGNCRNIYNPYSIVHFLRKRKADIYCGNLSSSDLVWKLLQESHRQVKEQFEMLLQGESIRVAIDEQVAYNYLRYDGLAIWSLLLAGGYLKVLSREQETLVERGKQPKYELVFTNYEVARMFDGMVLGWFGKEMGDYNGFVKALLQSNLEDMNAYMNRVALNTFSYFDTGTKSSGAEPERFYHGFVLGLMVELQDRYLITSNRESGFGRYDVVLEPQNFEENDAMILEFKVRNARREATLEDTVAAALKQIKEKQYAAGLMAKGIPAEKIRCYGFAFEGKNVWIDGSPAEGLTDRNQRLL